MDKKLSKFLSLILRHKPEAIWISLDEHGWADVELTLKEPPAVLHHGTVGKNNFLLRKRYCSEVPGYVCICLGMWKQP